MSLTGLRPLSHNATGYPSVKGLDNCKQQVTAPMLVAFTCPGK